MLPLGVSFLEGCCSIHLSYGRVVVQQQLTAQCFIALPNSAKNLMLPCPDTQGRELLLQRVASRRSPLDSRHAH